MRWPSYKRWGEYSRFCMASPRPIKKEPKRAKQFVALARVSSRAQEVEGTSLEVQEEALHAYAGSQGGEIIRLWKITETASKAERRVSFKELLTYAKAN